MVLESKSRLTTITSFSKALAAVLFILMPFVGVYIGYTYAPQKVVHVPVDRIDEEEEVVEVEKVVEIKTEADNSRSFPVTFYDSTQQAWLVEEIENPYNDNLYFAYEMMDKGGWEWPAVIVYNEIAAWISEGSQGNPILITDFEWLNESSFRYKYIIECYPQSTKLHSDESLNPVNALHDSDPRCSDVDFDMMMPGFTSKEWVYGNVYDLF